MQNTVILVHGAWHTNQCWNAVISRFDGTPVIAPAMIHTGAVDTDGISHECRILLELIQKLELEHIVLVGHSYGGTVIAELACCIPERIRHMIFLNAFVPMPGKCIMDDLPRFHKKILYDLATASGNESIRLPFHTWRDTFMNGSDPAVTGLIYDQLTPETLHRFTRPTTVSPLSLLDVPKSYIHATEDIALPPGKWGWLPRMPKRLGKHELIRIPGNHEVLFTAPDLVSNAILETIK